MNQEGIPVESQYLTYLLRHGQDAFTAKDYSSRVDTILEKFDDNFIINRGYKSIPGSRNFLSFDGKYIINKKSIEYIKADIRDYYLLNKRLNSFKDSNVEETVDEIGSFLEFILSNKLFSIDESSIKKYVVTLDREKKEVFIRAIKLYSDLKRLDIDVILLEQISIDNREEIEILEKLKIIAKDIRRFPWIKEEAFKIINID